MKPLFTCELQYFPCPHLSQIYDGFEKLRKRGIVDMSVKPFTGDKTKPLLKVVVDNKYSVIYDTLDGLNWIDGSVNDNLNHFKDNTKADYYFKRSYSKEVLENSPENCNVFPLGLNISYKPEGGYNRGFQQTCKDLFKDNFIVSKYFKKCIFRSGDFEYYPVPAKTNKVLFIARLWDPNGVSSDDLKTERESINKSRINCIKACRKEFGDNFVGGLQYNSYSAQYSKDLVLPSSMTNRVTFLKTIKEHNICIATTGLHNSIGWKFGEYVAASRAIISEPLQYVLPGDFKNNKNYCTYSNEDELLKKVEELLKYKDALREMMHSNFQYYNNYLRSDILVLNSLLKIKQNN